MIAFDKCREFTWKPFKDAPKDGQPILVFDPENLANEKYYVILWDGHRWELAGQLHYDSYDRNGFDKYFRPILWLPLNEVMIHSKLQ